MKDFLSFSFPEEAQLLAFGERLAKAFKVYLAEDSAHSLVVYLNGGRRVCAPTISFIPF